VNIALLAAGLVLATVFGAGQRGHGQPGLTGPVT